MKIFSYHKLCMYFINFILHLNFIFKLQISNLFIFFESEFWIFLLFKFYLVKDIPQFLNINLTCFILLKLLSNSLHLHFKSHNILINIIDKKFSKKLSIRN